MIFLLGLLLAQATPGDHFDQPGLPGEGLSADIVSLPAGADGAAFAQELVEAERLVPWNRAEPTSSSAPQSRFAYRARHAGNGREVVVYYDRDAGAGGHVCRVRRERGGVSEPQYAAVRWCAASFGIVLPARRPPAVRQD